MHSIIRPSFAKATSRRIAPSLATLAACSLAVMPSAHAADIAQPVPPRDTMSDTWVATDALGRSVPTGRETRAPKDDRTVGIFYFLWESKTHDSAGLFDISQILAKNPANPQWGTLHAFHWWSEPQLGYYLADDPWVIRKHAQMLADAGVDVIICDVTNAFTYPESYLAICKTYEEIRKKGGKTPQIAFITHAAAGKTAQKLYDDFYSKNLYPDLWYRWNDKPLILAKPDDLSPQLRDFFTCRESWAWSNPGGWFGDGKDKWPWLDSTPQKPGWHESADKPEQIAVAVAQHPTGNIGRSFHDGHEPPPDQQTPEKGLYFTEQWKRALEVDPQFVFVTGWNEWIAQRFESGEGGGPGFLGRRLTKGETFFVDEYTPEYSRDIEPMKGGFGDDYYYQLVANIRRYKGARPIPKASAPRTIRLSGLFTQWNTVGPEYRDDIGDTAPRDHAGFGGAGPYKDHSGRNDFDTMKVARDTKNFYFYVRTSAWSPPITKPDTKSNWMTLLLAPNGGDDRTKGWEGYRYAVRRVIWQGREVTALCENVGGRWEWKPILPVTMRMELREMHLAFPRAAIGLPDGFPVKLDFKWIDNVPDSGDIRDFLNHGDVAPNGRFRYRYRDRN